MFCSKGFPCGALLFGEPWMLWWLSTAALPLVIPWIVLRTPRTTRFAAMEILLRARGSLPLPQWLGRLAGPLLRASMLVLVALALAGPEFKGSPGPEDVGPDRAGHVAFLTGGPARRTGTPPLMAAVTASSFLECRLFACRMAGLSDSGGEDHTVTPASALSGARGIVLCDGVVLDAADRERVARFVERGGTAVVLLGPASTARSTKAATAALIGRLGGPRLPDGFGSRPVGPDEPGGAGLEVAFGRGREALPSIAGFPGVGGFSGVFVPLDGPRVRRFVPLDATGRSETGLEPVIARVRRPSGFEAVGTLVRRGAGHVAFVGIPLELAGLADGSWQVADTAAWDDFAAWPVFVDVVRRVFVPILEGLSAEPASIGDQPADDAMQGPGHSRTTGSSAASPAGGGLAGALLVLALVAAAIDPLCAVWMTGRSRR
jgi:hypothetical protein